MIDRLPIASSFSGSNWKKVAMELCEVGVWRPAANSKKPAIGGSYATCDSTVSSCRTAWLTWEDSNFHITISENDFEMSTEFLLFWPKIRLGDFCSCELWKTKPPGHSSFFAITGARVVGPRVLSRQILKSEQN